MKTVNDVSRLQCHCLYCRSRLQHFSYLQCCVTVGEPVNKSDHDMFCKLCAPGHDLNTLVPPSRNYDHLGA